ncbi:MAG TPA: hypothetical protein VN375_09090 [Vicinamibacteria bacterium]|nr:hypothetical protein [Vicinamibacteria bacterium]
MSERIVPFLQFLFIVAVPFIVAAGAVVTLFAVGALFDALEHPDRLGQRIEAAFRRAPKPPQIAGPDHYYRRYWSR